MFVQTAPATKSKSAEVYNVLYVDDEVINLRIFSMAFKRQYNVLTAESGSEAIEILNREEIHLLITDQKMPGMTGTELLLNTIEPYPDIIRIILTGFADIEAIVQAVNKCKIYKYITKPYDQSDMKLILDKALELFTVRREKEGLIDELAEINRNLELKVKERTLELEESNKRLTDGLIFAQTVQEFLLPKEQEIAASFDDAFVLYRPKDFVGGDFYWFQDFQRNGNDLAVLTVVDSMGHGVAGALLSMIGETQLNEITKGKRIPKVDTILAKLDAKLKDDLKRSETEGHGATMDATIIAIDRKKGTLEFCGAKLDLIYFKEGEFKRIRGTRKSLGSSWNEGVTFKRHILPLGGISEVYLFSDGFQDQFNGDNTKKFGSKRLFEMLSSARDLHMAEQKRVFSETLDHWQNDLEQVDDITLIGIRL